MPKTNLLNKTKIRATLSELNELSQSEYGIELEQLLIRRDRISKLRVQRLAGIVLKQKFATESTPANITATKARRAWPWKRGAPPRYAGGAKRELKLLNQLRKPGPWNVRKPLTGTSQDKTPVTWKDFKEDVEHERGLFKVVALYVSDKMKAKEGKTLRDYFNAEESPRFEFGLDLAVLVFDTAVVGPIASIVGLPTVAVALTLVGVQYGYRKLTDSTEEGPDSRT